MSVSEAAEAGQRRELLVALRTRIAAAVTAANTPPRDLAALSLRLMAISREIEALDADSKADDIGEAAATPDEKWTGSRSRLPGPAAGDSFERVPVG
jgi:hypothetical protein